MTTVGFLADLHLQSEGAETLLADLRATLSDLEALDLDLLVVAGDLVHDPAAERDGTLLAQLSDALEAVDAPVQLLPGNHDVESLTDDELETLFGDDRWTIDRSRDLCLLDTAAPRLEGARGELDDEQIDALSSALPAMERGIVVSHHPLYYADVSDNRWFATYPEEAFCGNKRAVEDLLTPANVAAVVNGHLHERVVAVRDGVLHCTVDSFNTELEPDRENGAYAVLRRSETLEYRHVSGDGTEHGVRLPRGDRTDATE